MKKAKKTNESIIVQLANPERHFTKCYHDFMDCILLNGEEKIIFLALKRFLDIKSNNGSVFPTVETIQKITGWGNQKVVKYIKSLVKKGVVKKIRQGLSKPNIYILSDESTIWTCTNVEDMAAAVRKNEIKPLTPEEYITELEKMGYDVTIKKREPETLPTFQSVNDSSTLENNHFHNQNTTQLLKSQERYTLEQVKQLFEYDIMLQDNSNLRKDIDSVIDILHTALNTTKQTIKIGGENKPTMVVIGKLMKLSKESIIYAIKKFSEQTKRIKNPAAYMLTVLYNTPEQFNLDLQNQIQHNFTVIK